MKKKQQRTCIGCGQTSDQSSLVRIIFNGQELTISSKINKEGRGVYLCQTELCLKKAIKRNAFSHRLKQKISPAVVSKFTDSFLAEIQNKLTN